MQAKHLLLCFCLWMAAFTGPAQTDSASVVEERKKPRLVLKGYVKNMQTLQMPDLNYIAHGNLIHNRLNFRAYPSSSTTFGLEVRNRVFTGDVVQYNPFFARSVDADNGLTDLSFLWLDERAMVGITQIDRAWIRWNTDQWDVTIGRQRINWGLNAFWNSNDLFNTFNLADFDYEERPGTDAVRVQHYFGNMRSLEVAIVPSLGDTTWVGGALYKFNRWTYDFQVLAGWWNEDVAAGIGWAGNVKGASFKGEATYFHPRNKFADTSGVVSTSISADYVFAGGTYAMAGFLYNSSGSISGFTTATLSGSALGTAIPPSAKNLMPARYSALLSVGRPLTPLVSASMVALYSPGLNLLFAMPSLSFSIASNWDFSIFAQSSFLDNGRIFRNYGTAVFGRLKWGF